MLHKLEVEYEFDFLLLAISCYEKDYRMCWLLNKALDLDMRRESDLEKRQKDLESQHSVFIEEGIEEELCFTLIRNRTENGVLLPELRQVDYLLRVDGYSDDEGELIDRIRSVSQVVGVYEVDPYSLQDRAYLIIE